MIKMGEYIAPVVYLKGEKYWRIRHVKMDDQHCHVHHSKGYAAVRAIIRSANKQSIPEEFPDWMIHDVNRLWFGQSYLESDKVNNNNLMIGDPSIRLLNFKPKKRKRFKHDKHTQMR